MSSTTICVTDTSVIPFPTLDSTDTQPSGTATGPLPHIPYVRPNTLTSSDTSLSDLTTPKSSESIDYTLQSRSVAHVRYESSSSSTPSDEIYPIIIPRSKRVASPHSISTDSHDIFTPITPASTPVKPCAVARPSADLAGRKVPFLCDTSDDEDALRPFPALKQTPVGKFGKLRLEGSAGKHTRHTSHSNVACSRAPTPGAPITQQPPQTIRKKSGQPVKSSLKSTRRPELHVVTDGPFAKSEPATPTHTKAVKFDSKLEHVKLFLAEQKPLAVSRDGSPTSDTSGDEFPSFIYGDGHRENQRVKMLVPNMPASPRKGQNVALQELVLSQDQRTITGSVHVRNVAYEKWLAVRFTLDWWQTTSEVTARYDKSIENGVFDVFTFTLRLHDIWPRIEEKTILFALRYTVAGREYWDNNSGKDYHVKFVLSPLPDPSSAVDNETSLRDLDLKLRDLAKAKSSPMPVTPHRLSRSFSADHQYSSFAKSSARYDFASAHKTQWAKNVNVSPQPNHHMRTLTYPSGVPATADSAVAPWSHVLNTRETGEATFSRPRGSSVGAVDDTPTPPARSETKPAPTDSSPSRLQEGRERHHRRGYMDKVMEGSPNLRRTPAGSPLKFDVATKDTPALLPRSRSFPLATEKQGPPVNLPQQSTPKPPLSIQTAPVDGGNRELTTPYETSQSSSSSGPYTPLRSPGPVCSQSDTSYKQLLDQFCFYTGADPLHQEPEVFPRSHSTSSIGHYMLSHSPPPSFLSHMRDLPARFSLDPSISTGPTAVHAR